MGGGTGQNSAGTLRAEAGVKGTDLVGEEQVTDGGVLGVLHDGGDHLQHGRDSCRGRSGSMFTRLQISFTKLSLFLKFL